MVIGTAVQPTKRQIQNTSDDPIAQSRALSFLPRPTAAATLSMKNRFTKLFARDVTLETLLSITHCRLQNRELSPCARVADAVV